MRKRKPTRDDFVDYILDQLNGIEGVAARKMFDGHGLYSGELFFGIICRGQLYFKTDDSTKQRYLDRGMEPFRPNRKQTIKTYFQVPADILDDSGELVRWGVEAIGCQERAGKR